MGPQLPSSLISWGSSSCHSPEPPSSCCSLTWNDHPLLSTDLCFPSLLNNTVEDSPHHRNHPSFLSTHVLFPISSPSSEIYRPWKTGHCVLYISVVSPGFSPMPGFKFYLKYLVNKCWLTWKYFMVMNFQFTRNLWEVILAIVCLGLG